MAQQHPYESAQTEALKPVCEIDERSNYAPEDWTEFRHWFDTVFCCQRANDNQAPSTS